MSRPDLRSPQQYPPLPLGSAHMHRLDGDHGGVATEYAILGALLALAFIGALTMMTVEIGSLYEAVQADVITAFQ